MNERNRRVVLATLALALACSLPAQAAQTAKKRHHRPTTHQAPVVQMPQDASTTLPTPTTEAGPVVSLPPPKDPVPGITVTEAKTRGIPIQADDPAVAVARNPR